MASHPRGGTLEDPIDMGADIVQLAKAFVSSNAVGATPLVRRLARRYRIRNPEISSELIAVLREGPARAVATTLSAPIDNDSKLRLVREERPVLVTEPIFRSEVEGALAQISAEHVDPAKLWEAGLSPTRTALFVGPPGVGKTLAARWLARTMDKPLIVLDLASVMSSYLGRTGGNVRRVLDYAREVQCVLLLDELDAVAKRRDDATEIGELKRLVTVLLQEIDTWPEGSLLIGATNHSELLDPAVWRRFETVIEFPLPDREELAAAIVAYLDDRTIGSTEVGVLATLYEGASFSALESEVLRARRMSAINELPVVDALMTVARARFLQMPSAQRIHLANSLVHNSTLSQRRISEVTGVSRDTLRRRSSEKST